jgi:hypothetical protein
MPEPSWQEHTSANRRCPGRKGGLATGVLAVHYVAPAWDYRAVTKDRTRRRRVARDVVIAVERSSSHPLEYAIMLLIQRGGRWHLVRTFDNAHGPEEHHEVHPLFSMTLLILAIRA